MKVQKGRRKILFVCNDNFFLYGAAALLTKNKRGTVLIAKSSIDLTDFAAFDYLFLNSETFDGWCNNYDFEDNDLNVIVALSMDCTVENTSVADYVICEKIESDVFLDFFTSLKRNKKIDSSHASIADVKSQISNATKRQREIICMYREGISIVKIAKYFRISVKTVYSHRSNFMRRFNIKNNVELLKFNYH